MTAAGTHAPVSRPGGAFDARIIAALVVAGMIGFIGYWLLYAFAPDTRAADGGGTHALSRAASGFSGLYAMAGDAGLNPEMTRQAGDSGPDDLLILTPPARTSAEAVQQVIGKTPARVLIILPKYETVPDHTKRGWERQLGRLPTSERRLPLDEWGINPNLRSTALDKGRRIGLRLANGQVIPARTPDNMVLMDGEGLDPIVTTDGAMLIGAVKSRPNIWIMSDPDLLNNLSLADDARATAALAILRAAIPAGGRPRFDLTLSGIGGTPDRSLLRMAFTPPFLGLTLCLLAAALMGLWQGFVRFGPPWRESRAVALGKAALIENSARLIVQARRLPHFAPRYIAAVREAAARRLHAPAGLTGAALDRWLDRFPDRQGQDFSQLAGALNRAHSPADIVVAARALGQWRKDIVRDSD